MSTDDHRRRPGEGPIRVLVVDDSAVTRQVMTALLSQASDLVVSVAADPIIATGKMARERPDVLVLDLEMPRMDGLTFLGRIMADSPMPVVVCSGHVGPGTEKALLALELGAVEIVTKPSVGSYDLLEASVDRLIDAIRAAAAATVRPRRGSAPRNPASGVRAAQATRGRHDFKVVAMGTSTGGTEALRVVLQDLPEDAPPILIVQHMPAGFTAPFAQRLDRDCRIQVKEAEAGEQVVAGRALVAPGNRHMELRRGGSGYFVDLSDGPLVSRHRPSVDVLFHSVAAVARSAALGVLMTGMGDDGANGLLRMKETGAPTIAQDEASSVVFGMPKEAILRGAAGEVLPLNRIAEAILRHQ